MTYVISKSGMMAGGASGLPDFVRRLTQDAAKQYVAAGCAMTADNTGGTADSATYKILFPDSTFVSTAYAPTNLATAANVSTALAAIQAALKTLYTQAKAGGDLLGVPEIT